MEQLYTINEVATRLGIADKTLRRWEDAGRFTPSRTLGNQRRYTTSDLQILDALKHGLINSQRDLLTAPQAATLCGVSLTTFTRWVDAGKIHPFITSSGSFYSQPQILSKLDTLKPETIVPPSRPLPPPPTLHIESDSSREMAPGAQQPGSPTNPPLLATNYPSFIIPLSSILVSLLVITLYHFLFVRPHLLVPLNPQGSVQGSATTNYDPRVDDLIRQFKNSQARYELLLAKPTPTPTPVATASATPSATPRGL